MFSFLLNKSWFVVMVVILYFFLFFCSSIGGLVISGVTGLAEGSRWDQAPLSTRIFPAQDT
jgi:hypothetical protein